MSYIKDRIARNRAESAEYRAAYDEEAESLARRNERRAAVMGQVAAMRKARGVTQQDVATALNVSQSRVSQIERGGETLSVDYLLDLLELLKVKMVFLGEDGPSPVGDVVTTGGATRNASPSKGRERAQDGMAEVSSRGRGPQKATA